MSYRLTAPPPVGVGDLFGEATAPWEDTTPPSAPATAGSIPKFPDPSPPPAVTAVNLDGEITEYQPPAQPTWYDPAKLGFPAMLPYEIVMRVAPLEEILASYNYSPAEYAILQEHPSFKAALATATKELADDGFSFRVKARLQAEELLKQVWRMIHDPATPHNVRADLIKSVVKWADLEPKKDTDGGQKFPTFAIQINL